MRCAFSSRYCREGVLASSSPLTLPKRQPTDPTPNQAQGVWRRPRAPSPRRPRAAGSQPSFRARVRAMGSARKSRTGGEQADAKFFFDKDQLYEMLHANCGRPLAAPPPRRLRPDATRGRRARIPCIARRAYPLHCAYPWPPVTRRRRTSPPSYTCPAPGMHLARAGHRSMR